MSFLHSVFTGEVFDENLNRLPQLWIEFPEVIHPTSAMSFVNFMTPVMVDVLPAVPIRLRLLEDAPVVNFTVNGLDFNINIGLQAQARYVHGPDQWTRIFREELMQMVKEANS